MSFADLNVPQNHVYLFKPHLPSQLFMIQPSGTAGICYTAKRLHHGLEILERLEFLESLESLRNSPTAPTRSATWWTR